MSYTAFRTPTAPSLSGRLDDDVWQKAPRTGFFVDMATGDRAILDTQAAVLWDDQNLYIGFWIEEPFPSARLTERDSLIFQENDVEVFIDGGDSYYEFEMNARNTVYEVFFIWKDAIGRFPRFDVANRDAVTFGGNFDRDERFFWRGTHPRGLRWAVLDYDLEGLRSAVHVDGVLNDRTRKSKGWTAEIAFPWASLKDLANGRSLPPQDGDEWRLFLGRFQKIQIGETEVQAAWCADPHGVYDTHMPERFTSVRFSTQAVR
ncbi:MAG TPA: carbohydrate-binding family 9-like protein [Fimbriimonas sp.]